ncbi:MAG: TatD family hydrolase [Chloroflexi bacterium]|nr:TatD family hydrolase [Chloroflexota bacterium]
MLVDTHAHLMDPAFADDLPAVLQRAADAGVAAMVCVGYDVASSEAAVALAEAHSQIVAVVGIHPNHAGEADPGAFQRIRELAGHPRVVGIGETGLDNYREHTARDVQRAAFAWHLDLAAERGLPVIVHNRDADAEVAPMLTVWARHRGATGVLHCFAGGADMLEAGLAAGFMVSFAGPITFKNAGALPERARRVPLDRLVVETDCPYLAPHPRRGQRNEPSLVRLTAAHLAELRGLPLVELELATTENARRLFPALPVPGPVSTRGAE